MGVFKSQYFPSAYFFNRKFNIKTSMHSSRKRTARLLPVSPSMHCAGGVSAPGGVCSGSGGVCSGGGFCLAGCIPACTEADALLVNRMTDRCKKHNLRKLRLRALISISFQLCNLFARNMTDNNMYFLLAIITKYAILLIK